MNPRVNSYKTDTACSLLCASCKELLTSSDCVSDLIVARGGRRATLANDALLKTKNKD